MATNRVFEVLKCLDRNDRKRFSKFMASPWFNQSKPLSGLATHLLQAVESGNNEFSKEAAWKGLFPEEAYDDVLFRKHCSDLMGHIEKFLAQQRFEQDKNLRDIFFLESVANKKIEPLAKVGLNQVKIRLEKQTQRSSQYYWSKYLFEQCYHDLMRLDEKNSEIKNVNELSENLDYFYFIEKLKHYCTLLSQRNVITHEYSIRNIQSIINQIKADGKLIADRVFQAYLLSSSIQDGSEDEKEFFQLKLLLRESAELFPPTEALNLYESTLNYATKQINKGVKEYYQELFDLYADALGKGLLLVDGEISQWRFGNIVVAATGIGKLEWAENFIDEFGPKLSVDTRGNTVNFNKMRVYFRQKRYGEALELHQGVEYTDFFYNLISKSLVIAAYYELDEFDALSSSIETFKVFLSRHKEITPDRKKQFLRFARFAKTLTRILPGDKKLIDKTRQDILENKNTPNLAWLLEKLTELEK